ncbi:MAG: glycogen debranching enzyme family protein [Acidobacteria bacterium]|nr:glycogen debranching enzyme family protein [Acidobacteriota bacterium]
MIGVPRGASGELEAMRKREWLETNGLGGYASSTVPGLNTRRYHGLLVAALQPPGGRMVLLSKLEETLVVNGVRFELATNCYPGAAHPQGYRFLRDFRLDPFPVTVFEAGGVEVEKRVFMVDGENTTVVQYECRSLDQSPPTQWILEVRPLIAFRDYHSTTRSNPDLNPDVVIDVGVAAVTPYAGLPTLYLAHGNAAVEASGHWYYNFEYEMDRERWFEDRDDLFNPFVARFDVNQSSTATIVASTARHAATEAPQLRRRELERRAVVSSATASAGPFVRSLTSAADQFIVRRDSLRTVIAGYHWFSDWGRDTMIALPGLTLTTGRPEIAREILVTFARHAHQGMVPNRFPDAGEQPEYNTVDATLWMFEAVRAYLEQTGDIDFVKREMYEFLVGVIDWHRRGTKHGIRVAEDGLLHSGEPGVQLTWMDAKVGDLVVTPRHGKPVEVQALWYNSLRIMQSLALKLEGSKRGTEYGGLARQALESFNREFWFSQGGYLFDVVDGEDKDDSLRPNQILAVSLRYSMLPKERARSVVEAVERRLLTPRGLRTLSPEDPRYRARYLGGVYGRDTAYHQGTVWPWLIGPFFTAWLKVNGRSPKNVARVRAWLTQFEDHLGEAGIGTVSEIFDADAPHHPRGCVAQAWSVAMLLQLAADIGICSRGKDTGSA